MSSTYPIGTPGQPWNEEHKVQWLANQSVKRQYKDEVLAKLQGLDNHFELIQYGALPYDESRYPLYILKSLNWQSDKDVVLVTGGVHGYETSGVQGAIRFVQEAARRYMDEFNFLIVPCVSPWGYETINRWNPAAIDPNRSFVANSPAPEPALLMRYLESMEADFVAHFDLHETTDTDNSEFRPALGARDGIEQSVWNIPDGFYAVGDTENPTPDFQKAVIESVAAVTHIAPADDNGMLIGAPLEQLGVINYAKKSLGLCGGMTNAKYVTTTEVYPDSPLVDDENCIIAQVAAITGGLDFMLRQ